MTIDPWWHYTDFEAAMQLQCCYGEAIHIHKQLPANQYIAETYLIDPKTLIHKLVLWGGMSSQHAYRADLFLREIHNNRVVSVFNNRIDVILPPHIAKSSADDAIAFCYSDLVYDDNDGVSAYWKIDQSATQNLQYVWFHNHQNEFIGANWSKKRVGPKIELNMPNRYGTLKVFFELPSMVVPNLTRMGRFELIPYYVQNNRIRPYLDDMSIDSLTSSKLVDQKAFNRLNDFLQSCGDVTPGYDDFFVNEGDRLAFMAEFR